MASEHLPVQLATRVLGVSESGYYEWRGRAPSQRAIRHAWLTDLIRQVHAESRGTYGARRVRRQAYARGADALTGLAPFCGQRDHRPLGERALTLASAGSRHLCARVAGQGL
jgi:hypothetical protein